MKISKISVLLIATSLMLGAAAAVAQDMPAGPMHMHRHGMFGEMLLPFHAVNLTDAQKTQIKQLHENAKPTMKPLFEQLRQNHEAMIQLVTSGDFSQAKAQALAAQSSQILSQLAVLHASITAQAYQLLTPEQKTQMTQVLAERQQRMQQWMQRHQQPEAPADSNQ
jgi:periplasmic protein CpxP/Spy